MFASAQVYHLLLLLLIHNTDMMCSEDRFLNQWIRGFHPSGISPAFISMFLSFYFLFSFILSLCVSSDNFVKSILTKTVE